MSHVFVQVLVVLPVLLLQLLMHWRIVAELAILVHPLAQQLSYQEDRQQSGNVGFALYSFARPLLPFRGGRGKRRWRGSGTCDEWV